MLALGLGLTAAAVWAVHDLMARKLSPGAALLPMVLTVLASGCVALVPAAVVFGDWGSMIAAALYAAAAGGLAFAFAIGTLYRAFSMAPARIVSPVIGAYPVLSLAIAVVQGRAVTGWDWVAVLAIVAGIAVISMTSGEAGDTNSPLPAMGWSALSAAGFATTFALGQEAARLGPDLAVILISRTVAAAAILTLVLARGAPIIPAGTRLWVLCAMGAFDAFALGLVTFAGTLAFAEYATIASSLFGVGTILLAAWLLKERLNPVQWTGVLIVFAGIGVLSAQG